MMLSILKLKGDLWLYCQEGGFADDALVLKGEGSLDDLIAEHFGIERQMPSGDRHVGWVRITIERLEEGEI